MRITILARKLSCMEGCNTFFDEAQPSSHFSCMTMAFRFLMKLRQQSKKNALVKHMSPDSGSLAPPQWYGPPSSREHRTRDHTYIHIHTRIHTYIPIYLPTYLHTYIPTYLRTYVPTYLRTHVHTYIHACMHGYIHTYLPTYIHIYIDTNIPTYQHTTTTGHGGGTRRTIPPPQATGGGTRRTIPPSQATGGTMGGLGRPGSYIYICVYICICEPGTPPMIWSPPAPKTSHLQSFGWHGLPIVRHLGGTASHLSVIFSI